MKISESLGFLFLLIGNTAFGFVYDEWLVKTDSISGLDSDDLKLEKINEGVYKVALVGYTLTGDLERRLNSDEFTRSVERQRADDRRISSKKDRCQCVLDEHVPNSLIQCPAFAQNTTALSDGDLEEMLRLQAIQDRNARLWSREDISISFNKFALDLFNQMISKKAQNSIISPYSIASALSMCYAGARGSTESALEHLLNYQYLSKDKVHAQNRNLIQKLLQLNGKVALKIANKLYTSKLHTNFNQKFLDLLQNSYNSEIEAIDFTMPRESSTVINEWVASKTENLIRDLISEQAIHSQVKVILVNVIYFKGAWLYKFDPKRTSNENFYLRDGSIQVVEMMKLYKKKLKLKIKPDGIEAVTCEFPYVGDQVAMTIILPNEGVSTEQVLSSLNNAVLLTIFDDYFPRRRVNAHVPKFKFEQSVELSDKLTTLGAQEIFDPIKANFTGIMPVDLHISKVIHKAVVEVNESGTEAAGASAVVMMTRSIQFEREEEPFEFQCNREFLFLITNKQTNTVLFLGKYSHK